MADHGENVDVIALVAQLAESEFPSLAGEVAALEQVHQVVAERLSATGDSA